MTNKDFFMQCWKAEMKITAKAVRALPDDINKWEYKPSPKTRSAKQIIGHILPHPEYLIKSMDSGVMMEEDKLFKSNEDAAAYLEKNSDAFIDKLSKTDDKTWETKPVALMIHGNKVWEAPMMNFFWGYLFDVIHHRGQLSTYYRPMGVRNPSIYGPTAEDLEEQLAAAGK